MSVIVCAICSEYVDTDFHATEEIELEGRYVEVCEDCAMEDEDSRSEPDESMDGDFDSGMASAGFGTDEDYGYYGEDE